MGEGELQAIGVPTGSTISSVSVGNRDKQASAIGVYDECGQLLGQVDCTSHTAVVNVVLDHPVTGPATLVVAMLGTRRERETCR